MMQYFLNLSNIATLIRIELLFLVILCLMFTNCTSESNGSEIPRIEFISISKDTMDQGIVEDSIFVKFFFTDGDGDLGNGRINQDRKGTISFVDSRIDSAELIVLQPIPQSGLNKGIEGEMTVKLFTTCCIYEDGTPGCEFNPNQAFDAFSYDIFIKDLKGNISNVITTPVIVLECK